MLQLLLICNDRTSRASMGDAGSSRHWEEVLQVFGLTHGSEAQITSSEHEALLSGLWSRLAWKIPADSVAFCTQFKLQRVHGRKPKVRFTGQEGMNKESGEPALPKPIS